MPSPNGPHLLAEQGSKLRARTVWFGLGNTGGQYSPETARGLAKFFVGPTWQFNFLFYLILLYALSSSYFLFTSKRLCFIIEQSLIYREVEKISQLAYTLHSVSPIINTLH